MTAKDKDTVTNQMFRKLSPDDRKEAERLKEHIQKIADEMPRVRWNGKEIVPVTTTFDGESIIARSGDGSVNLIPITGDPWVKISSLLKRKRTIEHNMVSMLSDCLQT